MALQKFVDTHGAQGIFRRWILEREVKDFLNLGVGGGVVLADVLLGHGVQDTISPQLLSAAQGLMPEKVASADQLAEILTERLMQGDLATQGFISLIKGRIGEEIFVETATQAGFTAKLAELDNQEAWDVAALNADGVTQYYQVKTMASADEVVLHMQAVSDKVSQGIIYDGDKVVDEVRFAVPDSIYAEVVEKASAKGLDIPVVKFQLTAQEAGQIVQDGFDNVAYWGLGNFFEQLAIGTLTAATLHTLVHAYLLHKGAAKAQNTLREISSQTALSATGIAAALGAESVLKSVGVATGSLPAIAVIIATALSVRGMAYRIASRRDYESWLQEANAKMRMQLEPPTLEMVKA